MELTSSGKRVAFFGGSFDPPHFGHLAVARAARAALGLDSVLFAPVGAQPLKPAGSTAPFEDRVAMTRLAIAGERGFEVSLADAPRPNGAPNYTFETLVALRASLPEDSTSFCLMGADAFLGLRGWHQAAEIPFVSALVVASRPGQHLDGLRAALPEGLTLEPSPQTGNTLSEHVASADHPSPVHPRIESYLLGNAAGETANFFILPELEVEISASQVRDVIHSQLEAPLSELDLLPHAVLDYIREHGLYR